ncbi:hypothetical protein JS756_03055 [Streptomyces actuosus]|uniref:Uncharacterized protein n=1 Tax=Streptomyces actuosus TaxID=1885 RepID=A0ABS2VJ50_STRAS|nr:hypothetical protein [Streptomyces actuosus]MBN0043108.1 hypothetical protein [Streptomyces actuosus]
MSVSHSARRLPDRDAAISSSLELTVAFAVDFSLRVLGGHRALGMFWGLGQGSKLETVQVRPDIGGETGFGSG